MKNMLIVTGMLLALGLAGVANADNVTLYSVADTYISELYKVNGYGSETIMEVTHSAYANPMRKGLLRFDLPTDIDTLTSATLRFYVHHLYYTGGGTVKVFRSLKPWVEDEVGEGYYNQYGVPNWHRYAVDTDWATAGMGAGTDYDNTESASVSINSSTGWKEVNVTGLVDDWVDNTVTNYGFALFQTGGADNHCRVRTREYGSHAPELVLEYTTVPIPEPGTMLLLGTGLLGIFGYWRRRRMK